MSPFPAVALLLCSSALAQGTRFYGELESRSIEPKQPGPSMPAPPPRHRGLPARIFEPGPSWHAWWSLHGPRILKPTLTTKPRRAASLSDAEVDRAAKTLRAVLQTAPHELTVPTLLALGKWARRDPLQSEPPPELLVALEHPDLAVRQASILGLGISGRIGAATTLENIALDRKSDRPHLPVARALAFYGLGLIAAAHGGSSMQQRVVTATETVLARGTSEPIGIRIGALHAVALAHPRDTVTLRAALRLLSTAEQDPLLSLQAPVCVAALLGSEHPQSEGWRDRYVAELRSPEGRQNSPHRRSAIALALGGMCAPVEDQASRDFEVVSALLAHTNTPKSSPISLASAWIAMGDIGGKVPRDILARSLSTAPRRDRGWVAIAIALAHSEALASGRDPDEDDESAVGDALRKEHVNSRSPATRGAYAYALGVIGCSAAFDQLRANLDRNLHHSAESAPTALAIALLEGERAGKPLGDALRRSVRRPFIAHGAAMALGIAIGSPANEDLLKHLRASTNAGLRAGIAQVLGRTADAATLTALERIVTDHQLPVAHRAAAVRAIGCALEPGTPWRDLVGPLVHLQASTAALVDAPVAVLRQL